MKSYTIETKRGIAVGLIIAILAALGVAGGTAYVATHNEAKIDTKGNATSTGMIKADVPREYDNYLDATTSTTSTNTTVEVHTTTGIRADVDPSLDNTANIDTDVSGNVGGNLTY